MNIKIYTLAGFLFATSFSPKHIYSQGSFTTIKNAAPHYNYGSMLLLTDGTVLVKTNTGIPADPQHIGNLWDKLTPDKSGSYVNGTWTTIAPMNYTRLYFGSQVLQDGRVFVAGAEYGTGGGNAEIYDPILNTWTMAPNQRQFIGDANSELLPDGKVLQAVLNPGALKGLSDSTLIWDPRSNTWQIGPPSLKSHDEATWVKLADNSILVVDDTSSTSERFIPSLNKWVADANVPVKLFDYYGAGESGPGILLPDGRAFFIGAMGHTAYYTPSGSAAPGTWAAGPDTPNKLSAPDAPGAMMPNGIILCCLSPLPDSAHHFTTPTSFYEFNYKTNSFTHVKAAGATTYMDGGGYTCYYSMLVLPDGTILAAQFNDNHYYVYTPAGAPLAEGKPVVNTILQNGCTYSVTGTLFNGISEGAGYGDDAQMATNYPLVRLTSGTNVYYARTFNWNSTGLQRGSLPDTVQFTLPNGLPFGTYSLEVIANGISSDKVSFVYKTCITGIESGVNLNGDGISVYPNPADDYFDLRFTVNEGGAYKIILTDLLGRMIEEKTGEALAGDNLIQMQTAGMVEGIYMVTLYKADEALRAKLIVK